MLLTLLLCSVLMAGSHACTCANRPIQSVVCSAQRLIKARIEGEIDNRIDFDDWRNQHHSRQYKATVLHVFEGDEEGLEKDSEIIIETAANGALCGVQLIANSVMLLELDHYRGAYQISMCDLARNWEYEVDDELMAGLVQGTLDCECQPSSRYGRSPCCNDNQEIWSVKMCTDQFGSCKKGDRDQCQWHGSYDYDRCLNDFGFRLGKDSCVEKKPCPKFATKMFSKYEQITCEDSGVRQLAWEKRICKCPEDRPILDISKDSCVTEFDCPRGARVEKESGFTNPPKSKEDDAPMEMGNLEISKEKIECPSNQVYYGQNECLPCIQTCGSDMAWCTRLCINEECGCPRDKPVMIKDSCYSQMECENVVYVDKDEQEPCEDDDDDEEKVMPSSTTDPCGAGGDCYQTKSKPPTTEPTEDLTSGPASTSQQDPTTESVTSPKPEPTSSEMAETSEPTEEGPESTEPTEVVSETTTDTCIGLSCLETDEPTEESTEGSTSGPAEESSSPTDSAAKEQTSEPTASAEPESSSSEGAEPTTSEGPQQTSSGTPSPTSPPSEEPEPSDEQTPSEGPTTSAAPEPSSSEGSEPTSSGTPEPTSPPSEEPTSSEGQDATSPPSDGPSSSEEATMSDAPTSDGATSSGTPEPTSPPSDEPTSSEEATMSDAPTSDGATSSGTPEQTSPPSEEPTSSEEPDATSPPSEESTPSDGPTSSGSPEQTSPPSDEPTSSEEATMSDAPTSDGATSSGTPEPTSPPSDEPTSSEEPETTEPMTTEEQATTEGEETTEPKSTQPQETTPSMGATSSGSPEQTSPPSDEPTSSEEATMSDAPTSDGATSSGTPEPTSPPSEPTDAPVKEKTSEPTPSEGPEPTSSEGPTSSGTPEPTSPPSDEPTSSEEATMSDAPTTEGQATTEGEETTEPKSTQPQETTPSMGATSSGEPDPTSPPTDQPTSSEEPDATSPPSDEPTSSEEQQTSEPTPTGEEQTSEATPTGEQQTSEPTPTGEQDMTSEASPTTGEQETSEPTPTGEEQTSEPTPTGEQQTSEPTPTGEQDMTSEASPTTGEQQTSEPTPTGEEQTSEPTPTGEQDMTSEPTSTEGQESSSPSSTEGQETTEYSSTGPRETTPSQGATSSGTPEVTSPPTEDGPEETSSEESTQEPTDSTTAAQTGSSSDPCGSSGDCFETISKHQTTEPTTTPQAETTPEPTPECEKEYQDLLMKGYDAGELQLCDENGDYLSTKCIGMDNCQCVDRDGNPVNDHRFYISDFECDFDRGMHCMEGLQFYECGQVYDRSCGLIENPDMIPDPEECHAPKCGCPEETPFLQGGQCVAEEDCVEIPSFQTIINDFFEGAELNLTTFGPNYDTCLNENPTCEAWAKRDMCDHKYLIKNCRPACGLCPEEEQRLTCQGVRDAMRDHLEENPVLGAPEVVCMEDDPDKYFPRQCVGSVCMCVNSDGISNDNLHHSIEHLYQCPGSEDCPGDQLFMNCAFNLNNCEEDFSNSECSQGCGCPYNMPYYNEEEQKCQSRYEFCPPSINVVEDMDCNEVAKGAEALNKIPPMCDERDETKYAPRQCGSDGVCYCVSADGAIEEEDVDEDYVCMRTKEECTRQGKEFTACGSSCPPTCENMFNAPVVCTLQCIIGCQCPEGTVENQEGRCVKAENCINFSMELPSDCRSREFAFNFIGREDDLSLPHHDCDERGEYRMNQCSEDGCYCVMPETGDKIEGTDHDRSEVDSYDCTDAVENERPTEYLTSDGSIVTKTGSQSSQSSESPDDEASTSYMETTTPVGPKNWNCFDEDEDCSCITEDGEKIHDSMRDEDFFAEMGQSREVYCDYRRNAAENEDCYMKSEEGEEVNCRSDGKYHHVQYNEDDGYYCTDEYGARAIVPEGSSVPQNEDDAEAFCMNLLKERREQFQCLQDRLKADHSVNNMLMGVPMPDCEDDGSYGPVQTRGAVSYCVNSEGEQFSDAEFERWMDSDMIRDQCMRRREMADNMDCSREKHEFKQGEIMVGSFMPDCDADGFYKPTQSAGSESYCAEPFAGKEIEGTLHNRGDDYDCEEVVNKILESGCYQTRRYAYEQSLAGMVGVFTPECNADGTYFYLQASGAVFYCANSEGQQLSGPEYPIYGTNVEELFKTCERVREMVENSHCNRRRRTSLEGGNTVGRYVPECDADGLYMATQSEGSYSFCVEPYTGKALDDTAHTRGDDYDCEAKVQELLGSACFQERTKGWESSMSGMVGVFEPECESDGTYHHTQFHGSVYFCAERNTGRGLEDSERSAEESEKDMEDYCEERRETLEESDCFQEMMDEGSEANCDDFGNYSPMQKDGDRHYCSNRDGDELIETEGGESGAMFCKELREIHDNSACYKEQAQQSGFGSVVVCDVRTGLYSVTQSVGSVAYCADQETGERIEGTDHPMSEAGRCGTIQDPHVRCAEVTDAEHNLMCTDEGMYFVQQCDAEQDQNCLCVDKWGETLEGASPHHISEQLCFDEERDNIRDNYSGSECEVERQISEALNNMGMYTAQCNDDGTFSRRQCTDYEGMGCFCLDSNGDHEAGSGHPSSEMRECGEVSYTFMSPRGAVEGNSGSIACSVFASYQDDSFEMFFDNNRYEDRDMDMWGDVKVRESVENFANGTVRTTLSIFVARLTMDMNEARFSCVSSKNKGSIIRDIMVMEAQASPSTPQPTASPADESSTPQQTSTPQPTTQPQEQAMRIFNEKRGYVYAESADLVTVREEVDANDEMAMFERMEDNTIRSVAFDLCLAQTIEGKKIVIKLKECKGNPTQTWLEDTDENGYSRIYVLRPGKKGKDPTEYYLDYFKQELTGYKETNKANQQWGFVYGDEQF